MNLAPQILNSKEFENFYLELTSRNHHFVPKDVQNKLITFKVLIAGCGSTGGACIEALARVGVCNFVLTDNGSFDLSNLNRQHARVSSIGKHKAVFHAEEIKEINPYCSVIVDQSGISVQNADRLVKDVDFVFDAVDVTTSDGIKAKVLLHESCHKFKKPVLSGLDLGYLQWGIAYNYHMGAQLLHGRRESIVNAKHPLTALFNMFSFNIIPFHCYPLIEDLMDNKKDFASQIGCTSDALSAVIVPAVLRYVEFGDLIKGWSIDLTKYRYSFKQKLSFFFHGIKSRNRVIKKLGI